MGSVLTVTSGYSVVGAHSKVVHFEVLRIHRRVNFSEGLIWMPRHVPIYTYRTDCHEALRNPDARPTSELVGRARLSDET